MLLGPGISKQGQHDTGGMFQPPVWSSTCPLVVSHLSEPMVLSFDALVLWIGPPSPALGLSATRTYFIGLAPLPHPRCVGCTDSKAVTCVWLQLHQLDSGAQDLVEDPGAVLDPGHILVTLLGCLLQ